MSIHLAMSRGRPQPGRSISSKARKRVAFTAFFAALAIPAAVLTAPMAQAVTCVNSATGSTFEIDPDANFVANTDGCIDWLNGTSLRITPKQDKPSGTTDDAFGQGTAENDANPTIVTGSIPPNKSDLKYFGVNTETAAGKFLQLFWTRVQNPSGTTNMDFELNQKFCDTSTNPYTDCANNGKNVLPETPVRTPGDKLITYDLSKGGTVPTISIRTWSGTVWGPATVISVPNSDGSTDAIGSINTNAITSANSGGIGPLDPYTFGEASISFKALFGDTTDCKTFGSAYLKSRSSDSFTAEIKDFISPEQVTISNCTGIVTKATASVTIGSPINDTATLSGATTNATGTITFKLYSDDTCSTEVTTGLTAVNVSGNGDYSSGNYTPTAVGTYYWIASYSGDLNNSPSTGACKDANESTVVNKAAPSISTKATTSVTIGSAISDTATLSGATSDATGTITFKLYSNDTCSTEVSTGLTAVNVSGNGDYSSGNFTPTAVGTYYWIASYSGDAKNTSATGTCKDANESTVVNKAAADIATGQFFYPQDSVTVSAGAGGTPTGTVTFKLFGPDATDCSGTAAYTESAVALAAGTAKTDNSTFAIDATNTGGYKWLVSYSGDASHDANPGVCADEVSSLTINDNAIP